MQILVGSILKKCQGTCINKLDTANINIPEKDTKKYKFKN